MCDLHMLPVSLHKSGRTFTCLYCSRVREYPPFDRIYYLPGHAFCDLCGRWMVIENYREFISEEQSEAARPKSPAPKS